MDFIFIRELRLPAWIGLYKYEKVAQQLIELDIEMAIPGTAVFRSRKHTDTIDYSAVVKRLRTLFSEERFGLIEALADRVAAVIIDEFHAPQVKVSIAKLGLLREAKKVGVCVVREGRQPK